ncbi:hypothetical protein Tco_0865688, partial [Tanacetum coccineum]
VLAPVNADTEGEKKSQAQSDPTVEVPASTQEEQQFTDDPAVEVSTSAQGEQMSYALVVLPLKENHQPRSWNSSSSKFSPTPPSKMADKGKGIAQSYGGDKLKQLPCLSWKKEDLLLVFKTFINSVLLEKVH